MLGALILISLFLSLIVVPIEKGSTGRIGDFLGQSGGNAAASGRGSVI
jgi:hypothetical protein